MHSSLHRFRRPSTLIMLGAGLLASDPLRWLVGTWTDAAYNFEGAWVALLVVVLAAWSYTSRRLPDAPGSQRDGWSDDLGASVAEPARDASIPASGAPARCSPRYAYGLLMASAVVRAAGQLLRVNVIGAATLALDVYALSIIGGLHQRSRPVSPGWLAVLFAFSLPLERAVQRVLGYGLQQVSAKGACGLLGLINEGVRCAGNRIVLAGQDLLVDLPCAGSRGLMLALMLFAALAAVRRPTWRQAAIGLGIAITAAMAANTLRIVALALGLAYVPSVDVMSAPWHELLGLAAFALSALPILLWAKFVMPAQAGIQLSERIKEELGPRLRGDDDWFRAGAFAAMAAVIVSLPARPIDVMRNTPPPALPVHLAEFTAISQPLNTMERAYFTQFGGGAARASYGEFAVMLVSTAAPLRHLHAPDECLRGIGHAVRYVGLAHGGLPSAIYRSTDADGNSWRVAVSYVSSRGQSAASIAQAVWLWLRSPDDRWTMIQRVAPWSAPADRVQRFEAAVFRALDLPSSPPQSIHLVPVDVSS